MTGRARRLLATEIFPRVSLLVGVEPQRRAVLVDDDNL